MQMNCGGILQSVDDHSTTLETVTMELLGVGGFGVLTAYSKLLFNVLFCKVAITIMLALMAIIKKEKKRKKK